jgi:hypothetical protein
MIDNSSLLEASGARLLSRSTGLATALWLVGVGAAMAQPTPVPSFALIGHIERFSLDSAGEPLSSASMTVRGITVILPSNLLITMPGRYMTAQEIFRGPNASSQAAQFSGLALRDNPRPVVPFEADIIGNISGGHYVAGVLRISQGALHTGAGFIQAIDVARGELRVGVRDGEAGARVRLNDPTGIYGTANGDLGKSDILLDGRFALDPDNSPVHASTGFPVCIPRLTDPEKCPATSRVTDVRRFTCAGTNPAALTPPAVADAPSMRCDPARPVPLAIGDYVTYVGMLQDDNAGGFIVSAHGLDAELGIYTSPGVDPVYVFVEEAIQGTKGERFANIAQEETTRFRIVGFTTDPTRNVEVLIVDSGRDETGFSMSGVGGLTPAGGAQLGRFRNTWPAKDDARAVRRDVLVRVVTPSHMRLPSGLTSGMYTAPINEYIYPELTSFGQPGFPLPVPFENFCFLAQGGGTYKLMPTGQANVGPLNPFPDSGHLNSQGIGNTAIRACGAP